MHEIAATATAVIQLTPAGAVIDDAGVDVIVAAFADAYDAGEAFDAASALMATAIVTLGNDGGGAAGRTLLALLLALHPALEKLDATRAQALRDDAEQQAARFQAFAGDADRGLDKVPTGARPEGTTRASPLARFALLGQTPKKTPER